MMSKLLRASSDNNYKEISDIPVGCIESVIIKISNLDGIMTIYSRPIENISVQNSYELTDVFYFYEDEISVLEVKGLIREIGWNGKISLMDYNSGKCYDISDDVKKEKKWFEFKTNF